MLIRDPAAAARLHAPLDAATQHLTRAGAYVPYDNNPNRELLYATYLAGLRHHDLTRLHAELDVVFPPSGAAPPPGARPDSVRIDVLRLLRRHVVSDHDLSLDQLAQLRSTFERVLTAPRHRGHHRHGTSNLTTLWVLTLCDPNAQPGAFRRWCAAQPEAERPAADRASLAKVRAALRLLLLRPNVAPAERQAVLARLVASVPHDQQAELFNLLTSEDRLLSEDEAEAFVMPRVQNPTE